MARWGGAHLKAQYLEGGDKKKIKYANQLCKQFITKTQKIIY